MNYMFSIKPKLVAGNRFSSNASLMLIRSLFAILFVMFPAVVAGQNKPIIEQNDNGIFPVPDSYRIEGIPPIEKSEVENLFYDPSMIKSNLIWDADWKNGKMLVTDRTNNIYLLNAPLEEPVKLIEKIVPNKVKIHSHRNNSYFAFTSDYEHEDNYQLYLYDFKSKSSKKLSVLTGKDESVESFVWNKNGDSIAYMKVDYDTKTSKLCESDLSAEKCFQIDLRGIWSVVELDGERILLKYLKASGSRMLYFYNVRANKLIPVDEQGKVQETFLFGKRLFWTSEGNDVCKKEKCVLYSDLGKDGTTKPKRLDLPKNLTRFDDVMFSPSGRNLLVQQTEDGVDVLRVFRLKNQKITEEVPQFVSGSYVIWNTRWLSETEIAYTLENGGKPASIQSYDIDSRKKTDWTKERLPKQLENKVKSPETINWTSFDGKEISGYIVRPTAAVQRKSPVLIFVHGGPQILDKPVFNSQDVRLATNLGLAIIHTNIRGSSGFGVDFMDADNGEKRGDAIKDIRALIGWIEKQPDLDRGQIFLRGESYGGFIVLSTALQEPVRIKAVIAEYPLVSIRGLLSQSWIDEFARNEYGDPKDENLMKKLDELSPLGNVSRWNSIPLLLTRGKLDARNPEKDVTDLKNQLQNGNSSVWYIYSTEDGHGFGSKYVTAAMFKFLKTQINKNTNEKGIIKK